jgi:hypothetical protein
MEKSAIAFQYWRKLMRKTAAWIAATYICLGIAHVANAQSHNTTGHLLRLFNTGVFGLSMNDAAVLLEPRLPGALNPTTIMVDVDKDRYFAATVTYPKKISFAEARRCLNSRYRKWEKESFANDPTMGLWRNEDDKLAVQLNDDGDSLKIVYIKFSQVTPEMFFRALGKAAEEVDKEKERPATSPED